MQSMFPAVLDTPIQEQTPRRKLIQMFQHTTAAPFCLYKFQLHFLTNENFVVNQASNNREHYLHVFSSIQISPATTQCLSHRYNHALSSVPFNPLFPITIQSPRHKFHQSFFGNALFKRNPLFIKSLSDNALLSHPQTNTAIKTFCSAKSPLPQQPLHSIKCLLLPMF